MASNTSTQPLGSDDFRPAVNHKPCEILNNGENGILIRHSAKDLITISSGSGIFSQNLREKIEQAMRFNATNESHMIESGTVNRWESIIRAFKILSTALSNHLKGHPNEEAQKWVDEFVQGFPDLEMSLTKNPIEVQRAREYLGYWLSHLATIGAKGWPLWSLVELAVNDPFMDSEIIMTLQQGLDSLFMECLVMIGFTNCHSIESFHLSTGNPNALKIVYYPTFQGFFNLFCDNERAGIDRWADSEVRVSQLRICGRHWNQAFAAAAETDLLFKLNEKYDMLDVEDIRVLQSLGTIPSE